jgi:hypothetical protein
MGVIAVLQFVFLPAWTPPQRAFPAAIVALVVSPLIAARRWFYQFHTVGAALGNIEFRRAIGTVHLPSGEVVALIAVPGFNWKQIDNLSEDVKRLVSWRKLVILTEQGRHNLPFEAEECPQIYEALRVFCPSAWGIPYPGNLELPSKEGPAANQAERLRVLKRIRRFYRLHAAINAIVGLTLLVGCTAVFAIVVASFFTDNPNQPGGNGFIFLTMFAVAGGVFLKDVPRDLRILSQLRREIRKSRS